MAFLVENQVKMHQLWLFFARFALIETLFAHLRKSAENKMSFEIHVTTIAAAVR